MSDDSPVNTKAKKVWLNPEIAPFRSETPRVSLLEIACRFWKWFAHLRLLGIAIIRYLTEGTLQFRNIRNHNRSFESESLIQNAQFYSELMLWANEAVATKRTAFGASWLWALTWRAKSSPPVFGANPLHSMALSSPPPAISPISQRARGGNGWSPCPDFTPVARGSSFAAQKPGFKGNRYWISLSKVVYWWLPSKRPNSEVSRLSLLPREGDAHDSFGRRQPPGSIG